MICDDKVAYLTTFLIKINTFMSPPNYLVQNLIAELVLQLQVSVLYLFIYLIITICLFVCFTNLKTQS